MTTSKSKAGAQQELIPAANQKRANRLGARNNLRLALLLNGRLDWIKQTGASKAHFATIAAKEIGVAIHDTNVTHACRSLGIDWPNGAVQKRSASTRTGRKIGPRETEAVLFALREDLSFVAGSVLELTRELLPEASGLAQQLARIRDQAAKERRRAVAEARDRQ